MFRFQQNAKIFQKQSYLNNFLCILLVSLLHTQFTLLTNDVTPLIYELNFCQNFIIIVD